MSSETGGKSPFPTRRELREQAQKAAFNRQEGVGAAPGETSRNWWHLAFRGGLLAALSLATIVVPAMGVVGPETTITVPPKAVIATGSLQTWVTVTPPAAEDASYLRKVSSAASRARVRKPLEVRSCGDKSVTANGDRPVEKLSAVSWPVSRSSISLASTFGPRFLPGVGYNLHTGLDMSGPIGTPIYAVADGTVVEAHHDGYGYGYLLVVEHRDIAGKIYKSAYAHMYPEQVLVRKGDKVKMGQHIAGIGSNGWSTGPHLHFEIRDEKDNFSDPYKWLEKMKATQPGEGC